MTGKHRGENVYWGEGLTDWEQVVQKVGKLPQGREIESSMK